MKKRILSMILTAFMVFGLVSMTATAEDSASEAELKETKIVTYSLFDVTIPFNNMADCQRTLYESIGSTQTVHKFSYVYTTSEKRINVVVPDVETNPENYYYKFSEGADENIVLKMYKYNDASFTPVVLFENGYIQTYGDGCFIYVGDDHYGSFVSFRDKDYHYCNKDGCASHSIGMTGCPACGCGEEYIIRGKYPDIEELKALPMSEDLVEIEHKHQYSEETGKCACGEFDPEIPNKIYVAGQGLGNGSVSVYYKNGDAGKYTGTADDYNAKLEKINGVLTLTLNDFEYEGALNGVRATIGLKIVLEGENNIKSTKTHQPSASSNEAHGIYAISDLEIVGTEGSTLNVESVNANGIMAYSTNQFYKEAITITGANITAIAGGDVGIVATESLTIKDSVIDATGDYHGVQGGGFRSSSPTSIVVENSEITAKATLSSGVAFKSAPVVTENYKWRSSADGEWKNYVSTDDDFASAKYVEFVEGAVVVKYAVTISDEFTNGKIETDKAEAEEGEEVTLTITPAEDYALSALVVDGEDVTEAVADGKYTFTMPAANVEVTAVFEEVEKAYMINSVEELLAFAQEVNSGKTFEGEIVKLGKSLDVSSVTNWAPIGTSAYPFKGTFDGNFHIIVGLTIKNGGRYTGFFGRLDNATIKNLGIENANIEGTSSDVGVFAGNAKGGSIERCYATGAVKGTGGVGGILGSTHSRSYETKITNCYARVSLAVSGTRNTMDFAGISGWNETTSVKIENCYSASIGEKRPIAGWSDGSAVKNSQFVNTYFDKTLSPDFSTESGRADLGKTAEELKSQETYTGWDFENIWAIDESINGGYPYLLGFDNVALEGAPGSVTVILVDRDGNPVEGANVVISDTEGNEIVLFEQDGGIYSATVTTKDEIFTVMVDNKNAGTLAQEGKDAVSVTIVIAEESAVYKISGTITLVRDFEYGYAKSQELGIDNAGEIVIENGVDEVYKATEETLNITENADGNAVINFATELPAGTYTLTFTKNGYTQETDEFTVADKDVVLDNIVPTGGDIRGALDADCGDGKVNMDDYIRVLRGFANNSSEYLRFSVDINEDGIVNVNDLAIIKANFNKTSADSTGDKIKS